MKNFGQKHIPYKITGNIKSKKYEYCSKLVWQSYYFGAGKGKQVLVYSELFKEARKLLKNGDLEYLKEIDPTEYIYQMIDEIEEET